MSSAARESSLWTIRQSDEKSGNVLHLSIRISAHVTIYR
jgi:hypothetical protein